MAIIGFNFTKLSCERKKSQAKGSLEIKHNVSIIDVEKTSINLVSSKADGLKISFSFDVLYGASVGAINIAGDIVYSETKEIIEETLKGYKADKKLNSVVASEINQFVYSKSIIKALEMADSTNLPAPIPIVPAGLKKKK